MVPSSRDHPAGRCYRCWTTARPSHSSNRISPSRASPAGTSERSPTRLRNTRVWVDHHLARVVARGEALTDKLVETELLRTRHFNSAIHWCARGDPADRLGDVISRHGLNERRGQPNHRSVGGVIGDALDELEELRRVNNRDPDPATFDQRLLSVLRSEIGTVGYPLGSHDGKRNVMLHTGCRRAC